MPIIKGGGRSSRWELPNDSSRWELPNDFSDLVRMAIPKKDPTQTQIQEKQPTSKHLASMGIKASDRNELKKTYPEQMQSLEDAVEKFIKMSNLTNVGNINYALAALNEVVKRNGHNYKFKRFTPNL